MKLWGGPSDTGCCSVADVDDARRVAQQLGIAHHVFNFSEEFDREVVEPYVADHAAGRTPNPCVECNRHLKFDRLLVRAAQLGFDAVATGHHARVRAGRRWARGPCGGAPTGDKDQSYVLHMLAQAQLARVRLPVGELTKSRGRARSPPSSACGRRPSRTARTCASSPGPGGREAVPRRAHRAATRPGSWTGPARSSATVPAVELVTVGQRQGAGCARRPAGAQATSPNAADRRYVVDVDVARCHRHRRPLEALLCGDRGPRPGLGRRPSRRRRAPRGPDQRPRPAGRGDLVADRVGPCSSSPHAPGGARPERGSLPGRRRGGRTVVAGLRREPGLFEHRHLQEARGSKRVTSAR